MADTVIDRWHAYLKQRDDALLDALITDDVVFHSPVVHTPQKGKMLCKMYLQGAISVLGNSSFQYVNEWYSANGAVLEFSATIDGIVINGVDIIAWNDEQKITEFKVLLRPLKAVNLMHQKMRAVLESMSN
ncbi:MAG: nuclear transport factor 2 family protein [Pseudomonadales bacterium]